MGIISLVRGLMLGGGVVLIVNVGLKRSGVSRL